MHGRNSKGREKELVRARHTLYPVHPHPPHRLQFPNIVRYCFDLRMMGIVSTDLPGGIQRDAETIFSEEVVEGEGFETFSLLFSSPFLFILFLSPCLPLASTSAPPSASEEFPTPSPSSVESTGTTTTITRPPTA